MSDSPNEKVQTLSSQSKAELKRLLSEELGGQYSRSIPGSLRNDLLRACYATIEPGEEPLSRARQHPEFDSSWREKRALATALRMLLAEKGVREAETPLMSLDKSSLAQIIVAIRIEDGDENREGNHRAELEVPSRPTPAESPFPDRLLIDEATEEEIRDWVSERRAESQYNHVIYTLDCTPPIGEESESINKQLAKAAKSDSAGTSQDEFQRAAGELLSGSRIYYVGYTSDVVDRIHRHQGGGAYGGAAFTNTYHPQALVDVEFYETEAEARRHEGLVARKLLKKDDSFSYWD